MVDAARINPKITLTTKARLEEFCKERGHSQGDVINAALEAYFTPADGDTQTLMFQKINGLEQGVKDVVTLLGSIIDHLERQTKPLPPKIATVTELYPAFAQQEASPPAEESAPPTRSSWRGLFGKGGQG